jgi:hypothetical protein
MDILSQIAVKIIRAQEAIIGPIAIEQAQRVPHLNIDWNKKEIKIDGNETEAVELFGQISKEVSKEAAAPLLSQLPAASLPEALK